MVVVQTIQCQVAVGAGQWPVGLDQAWYLELAEVDTQSLAVLPEQWRLRGALAVQHREEQTTVVLAPSVHGQSTGLCRRSCHEEVEQAELKVAAVVAEPPLGLSAVAA